MNRTLLLVSVALMVAGVALMVYADPLARLSLPSTTGAGTSRSFGLTGTETFTIGSSTVTVGPGGGGFGNFTGSFTRTGGFPTGGVGGPIVSGSNATDDQVEALIAVMLIAVGLILEIVTVFLWPEAPAKTSPQTTSE